MAMIITRLKHCYLGIENLDKLIIIMKNWPNDLKLGCVTSSMVECLEEYLDVYNYLFEKNEKLITNFGLFKED
jgi:hypothetical protein